MTSERITLHFPKIVVGKPIVNNLIKHYNLSFNIMKARISPDDEGHMVLEITGSREDLDKGITYLKSEGIGVHPIEHDIIWDEHRCTSCGSCTGFCPTQALWIDRETMKVSFNAQKCIMCELCLRYCPTRALRITFDNYM